MITFISLIGTLFWLGFSKSRLWSTLSKVEGDYYFFVPSVGVFFLFSTTLNNWPMQEWPFQNSNCSSIIIFSFSSMGLIRDSSFVCFTEGR